MLIQQLSIDEEKDLRFNVLGQVHPKADLATVCLSVCLFKDFRTILEMEDNKRRNKFLRFQQQRQQQQGRRA